MYQVTQKYSCMIKRKMHNKNEIFQNQNIF